MNMFFGGLGDDEFETVTLPVESGVITSDGGIKFNIKDVTKRLGSYKDNIMQHDTSTIIIMLGIIISLMCLISTLYDISVGIGDLKYACYNSDPLHFKLNLKSGLAMVMYTFIALIGFALIYFTAKNHGPVLDIITLGIILFGIFGVLYSIMNLIDINGSEWWKVGASATTLVIFLLAGMIKLFMMKRKLKKN